MARDNNNESISLTCTAHHLTARPFMFNSKAAGVHLFHMHLREGSTNLRMQNVISSWQSRDSQVYGMKEIIQYASLRGQLIHKQTAKFYCNKPEEKI